MPPESLISAECFIVLDHRLTDDPPPIVKGNMKRTFVQFIPNIQEFHDFIANVLGRRCDDSIIGNSFHKILLRGT